MLPRTRVQYNECLHCEKAVAHLRALAVLRRLLAPLIWKLFLFSFLANSKRRKPCGTLNTRIFSPSSSSSSNSPRGTFLLSPRVFVARSSERFWRARFGSWKSSKVWPPRTLFHRNRASDASLSPRVFRLPSISGRS